MLQWTFTFLLLALIAGIFGFGDLAGGAASIARILFFLFVILLVVSGFSNVMNGKSS